MVEVEADVSDGVFSFDVVGLPRSGIQKSGAVGHAQQRVLLSLGQNYGKFSPG